MLLSLPSGLPAPLDIEKKYSRRGGNTAEKASYMKLMLPYKNRITQNRSDNKRPFEAFSHSGFLAP